MFLIWYLKSLLEKMRAKKPVLEIISPFKNASLQVFQNRYPHLCHLKAWHCHPEIELVYIPSGRGTLFIGNTFISYQQGVIVLLYSNIQHLSFDQGHEGDDYQEIVIQIPPSQIEKLTHILPEFQQISELLKASKSGVILPLENCTFESLFNKIRQKEPLEQLLTFFEILSSFEKSNYQILDTLATTNINQHNAERIGKVFDYIAAHFKDDITSQAGADLLHLTNSSFCRFFLKHKKKTFKQVLNEYRVAHAYKLLQTTDKAIQTIAYESGYSSHSFFNKMFKRITGKTPLAHRNTQKRILVTQ